MSMNISGINSTGMISGGGGPDEEYRRIIAKLLQLGIMPSGNKAADKAKLREIEMKQLKTELGTNGKGAVNKAKYVTISSAEIEQLKEKLKAKEKENQSPEMQEKRQAAEKRTGAEQQARLNRYFLT